MTKFKGFEIKGSESGTLLAIVLEDVNLEEVGSVFNAEAGRPAKIEITQKWHCYECGNSFYFGENESEKSTCCMQCAEALEAGKKALAENRLIDAEESKRLTSHMGSYYAGEFRKKYCEAEKEESS